MVLIDTFVFVIKLTFTMCDDSHTQYENDTSSLSSQYDLFLDMQPQEGFEATV